MTEKMKTGCRRAALAGMLSLALAIFGGAAPWEAGSQAAARSDAGAQAAADMKAAAPAAWSAAQNEVATAARAAAYAAEQAAA